MHAATVAHFDGHCCCCLCLLLQEATVLGYLAEAAAQYGCSLQRVQQLQDAAGLSGDAGGSALLWRLVAALNSNKGCTLSFLKSLLPSDITYGQVKVGGRCSHICFKPYYTSVSLLGRFCCCDNADWDCFKYPHKRQPLASKSEWS
jgi:hypothetical protein